MPVRKVFGRQAKAKSDPFASMLYSSPDTRTHKVNPTKSDSLSNPMEHENDPRRSPRRKLDTILQPVCVNVASKTPKQPRIQQKKDLLEIKVTHNSPKVETTRIGKDAASKQSVQQHTMKEGVTGSTQIVEKPLGLQPYSTLNSDHDLARCIYTQHCAPLLNPRSQEIEDFAAWSSHLVQHLDITKIAEASYGEVYRLSFNGQSSGLGAVVSKHEESVLKVIALTPPEITIPTTKRGRSRAMEKIAMMSNPADVASEIRLLQRMSHIPGFTDFRDIKILKGRPPKPFIKAYKAFNHRQQANDKPMSTFPDPAKKTSYSEDQLWAVIEMQDAGTDLERLVEQGECRDIWNVWDVFWQVALALAKGEEGAQFEHRDLHLGNICVRRKGSQQQVNVKRNLGFTNLDVTLIDYTISRATMLSREGMSEETAYLDLVDDQYIFNGDSTQEYQYDIYRYMRSALFHDDALADFNSNSTANRTWKQFHPQTNLIWLHFVLFTLLGQMTLTSEQSIPSKKKQREHSIRQRAIELERILSEISTLLDPQVVIKNGIRSTCMLVAIALEKNWLQAQDVIGPDESTILEDLVGTFDTLLLEDTKLKA